MKQMRLDKLRENIDEVDAFLVTYLPNIRYLVSYTGSNGLLLITLKEALFFTDFRYKEQSAREVKDAEIVVVEQSLFKDIVKHPIFKSLKKIGFEPQISYMEYEKLVDGLQGKELLCLKGYVEELRMIKYESELANIKAAARIADAAFAEMQSLIKPGIKENDIAMELDYQIRKSGATGTAFKTIVASGPNAALPHARSSDRVLKDRDTVIFDFGALYNGYASDITRTIILGENSKAKKLYQIVLEAQEAALNAVKVGVSLQELDKIARDIIIEAGYGEYFGHGLGHGVGLEVHEAPKASTTSEDIAEVGMVFTVEPGIYLPEFGGVRIEDLVIVEEEGCEIITQSPKTQTGKI